MIHLNVPNGAGYNEESKGVLDSLSSTLGNSVTFFSVFAGEAGKFAFVHSSYPVNVEEALNVSRAVV